LRRTPQSACEHACGANWVDAGFFTRRDKSRALAADPRLAAVVDIDVSHQRPSTRW
jgi:hypothetical protein